MLDLFVSLAVAAILTSLLIGTVVVINNASRYQNRAFALFAFALAAWSCCTLVLCLTRDEDTAKRAMQVSTWICLQLPLGFRVLCQSILYPNHGSRQHMASIRYHFVLSQLLGLAVFTPLYVTGAGFDSTNNLPFPLKGDLFTPIGGFMIAGALWFVLYYVRLSRPLEGIRRTELQYVLLAVAIMVLITAFTHVIVPARSETLITQPLGALANLACIGTIAYGIATQRLLDVSTVLQRATAYIILMFYLVGLYLLVWKASTLLLQDQDTLPHLVAALVLAFSMTPVQGALQHLSRKLFITGRTWTIEDAVRSGGQLFTAITTMDELINRFIGILAEGGFDAESVRALFPTETEFVEFVPQGTSRMAMRLGRSRALATLLDQSREPVLAYALKRVRPRPDTREALQDLNALHAELAVGLYFKDELRGIVMLGARVSGRIYSRADQDALQVLCDQLAVALENAGLYTEVQNNKIYNDILVDSLVSGVIAVDRDGIINVINREAQRITGLNGDQALGCQLNVLPDALAGALREALEYRMIFKDREVTVETDEGQQTDVNLGSALFYSSARDPLGALLVFADLTEQKKLETQVRRSDRLASIGTLSAGMAHEIKNPLVTIRTFTELLPERYQDADFRDTFSNLVSHEVQRIDRIVNQLLHFARPAKADLMDTSLHGIIRSSLDLMQEQLRQRRIQLAQHLEAEEDRIQADEGLLDQALINFFFNAADSMEEGGSLTVSTDHTPPPHHLLPGTIEADRDLSFVRLTIRDTGTGIPPQAISQVFDPFFTTKNHGTGLGLAIAHGIVKEHNGLIDVDSQVGQGTTFSLYIPLATREAAV